MTKLNEHESKKPMYERFKTFDDIESFLKRTDISFHEKITVVFLNLSQSQSEGFTAGFERGGSVKEIYEKAMKQVIEMNYQNAKDQYGDRSKAKSWACVTVLEEALGSIPSGSTKKNK